VIESLLVSADFPRDFKTRRSATVSMTIVRLLAGAPVTDARSLP